jgi:hypothetical protein
MPKKKEEIATAEREKKEIEIYVNPAMPTVFSDKVQLMVRNDGLAVLRWIHELPELHSEVARVLVTQDHLKKIIDLFCRNTGYYPTPSPDTDTKAS